MLIGTSLRTPAGTAEVSVLTGGMAQPLYRHPGGGRPFVAGVPGRIYTLRVRNLTGGRIEVISTVDGRNTLRDEPGDAHANRGLIFGASTTGEFAGWRISDEEVREFIFGDPAGSVAAQAGEPGSIGVIGFAVYRERVASYASQPFLGHVSYAASAAVAAPAARAVTCDAGPSLGTGIGDARADHVGSTSFTRADGEPDIVVIGYETEAVLRERGLIGPAEADAFPGQRTGYEKYTSR